MIRAMVWKEFREQGLIALTLLVLGTGILVAAAVLGDPPAGASGPTDIVRALGAGRLAALMLAVTAGTVCGGALFAAERESGTIGFLESLPARRGQLWLAKLVAGAALAAAQVAVVLAVAWLLGVAPPDFAGRVAVYAGLAFVWGVFGSTVSRTTLGSVGVAIPCAVLAAFAFLIPVVLFFPHPGTQLPRVEGEILFLVLMVGTPLAMSATQFTRQDRERASEDLRPPAWVAARAATPVPKVEKVRPPRPERGARFGLKALVWLAAKQAAFAALVLSAFAVLFGLMMLAPGVKPILVWPSLALAAGVMAGATVFADEQASGSARFWGDWRLPAGRMWAVKVAVHAALALWLVFLLLTPLAVRSQFSGVGPLLRGQTFLSAAFGSLLFDELERHGWKLVLLPAVYGFAAGHLCGMLFKKVVVAVGVAGLLGGTAAMMWIPSLLAGGVLHWQVWTPPLLALGVARLLVRPWGSNRLGTRRPIITLAAGGAVVVAALAVGLGYRVLEVPARADGEADVAYVASLPLLDENTVGRDMRSAGERYARLAAQAAAPFDQRMDGRRRLRIDERLDQVAANGWTADPEVVTVLNAVFGDKGEGPETPPWFAQADAAADRPTGMYEDPRLVSGSQTMTALDHARRMAAAVVARGLQRQAEGDPAEFVRSLKTVLGVARNVRNNSVVAAVNVGNGIERAALLVPVEKWLAGLDGRPELLRAALAALVANDPRGPFDPTPHLLAERHMLREMMKAPAQWVPDLLTPGGKAKGDETVEADLVAFGWTVPWERERTRRLVGLGFEGTVAAEYYRLIRGRPGRGFLIGRFLNSADLSEHDRLVSTFRRVAAVRVAAQLHVVEKGHLPAAADGLREYLPGYPRDPYDDAPLRYRRADAGETLGGSSDSRRPDDKLPSFRVEPGQAVVWSVGPNRTDEGGKQMPFQPFSPLRIDDLVFVVPAARNAPPPPPK